MLWLYILSGIILFLLIVSVIPIKLILKFESEFYVSLIIGFIKIPLVPQKPKKKKSKRKAENQKNKPKKEENKNNILKEKGIGWIADAIKKVSELAKGVLKDFFAHIIIKRMTADIVVSEDNAADTAITYGKLCSVVYPAVGIVAGSTRCEKYEVEIYPDFDDKAESRCFIDLEAKTLVLWIFNLIVKNGIKALKLFTQLKGE